MKAVKKHLHKVHHGLSLFSTWYFVIALIVSGGLAVSALRNNNITALSLRDKVNKVDELNGDVELALQELRAYVYAHMNTDLASGPNAIKPPIQLKHTYERLVATEKARVSSANAKIYTDAQKVCETQVLAGLSGSGRIPCIQDYVTKHGEVERPVAEDLYKFDFASPVWSPDVAGVSLLLTGVFGLLLAIRLSLWLWLGRIKRQS